MPTGAPTPANAPACERCRQASHETCTGCTGCGCTPSAQWSHHRAEASKP
jgi:hypothetical protein